MKNNVIPFSREPERARRMIFSKGLIPDCSICMEFEPSRLAAYDRESALAEMVRVADLFFDGIPPSHREFNLHSRVHSSTVVKLFGTWTSAWREAGKESTRSRVRTSTIVSDLEKVLQIRGGYFSFALYKSSGGLFSYDTINRRFGDAGWQKVLETALNVSPDSRPRQERVKANSKINVDPNDRPRDAMKAMLLPEHLLVELRSIASKSANSFLSYRDYRRFGGSHSHDLFKEAFGSWGNAVRLLGLKTGRYRPRQRKPNFTEEDYFGELQRIWEKLGRQPKAREMKANGSKLSHQAFQKRFGSWVRAIHAFCNDRNAGDEEYSVASDGSRKESTGNFRGAISETANSGNENGKVIIRKRTPRKPSDRLRWKVYVRDGFRCKACGRDAGHVVLEVDHIVPYSAGGETVLENLQLLCEVCNSGKSDTQPSTIG